MRPVDPAASPLGRTSGCPARTVRLEGADAQASTGQGGAPLGRAALGRAGERLALQHLVADHGFAPVVTNLRVAVEDLRGELDLVVRDPRSRTLVVVEVKTRSGQAAGGAAVTLGPRQQARIRRMTAYLLASGQLQGRQVRFDLVTVDVVAPRLGTAVRLGHLPDAW
jgi:putative endonuclease